jgi:hypothetical protein
MKTNGDNMSKQASPIQAAIQALTEMDNALKQGKSVWCGYSAAKMGMYSHTNWDGDAWQKAMQFFEAVSELEIRHKVKEVWTPFV